MQKLEKKKSQALCRARINERGQFSVVHMKFQAAVWPQIVIDEGKTWGNITERVQEPSQTLSHFVALGTRSLTSWLLRLGVGMCSSECHSSFLHGGPLSCRGCASDATEPLQLKNCVCGTDSSTVNLYMSHRSYCSGVSVCVSMHACVWARVLFDPWRFDCAGHSARVCVCVWACLPSAFIVNLEQCGE